MDDLNSDGWPDLVHYTGAFAPSNNAFSITTYLGQMDGTFTQSYLASSYSGVGLFGPYLQFGDPLAYSLVADYNADGKLDEAAFQSGYTQFLMGNGDGTFTPTYDVFPSLQRLGASATYPNYAHDLNGDGYADLIGQDIASNTTYVIKGGPAPTLQPVLNDTIISGNNECGTIYPDVVSASSRSVTFSSSISGVMLPSSIALPGGAASVNFCFSLASSFDWRQVFDINATLDGSTNTIYSSQVQPPNFTITVTPTTTPTIYWGKSTPINVTVTSMQSTSDTIMLNCSGYTLQYGDGCIFNTNPVLLAPGDTVNTTGTILTSTAGSAATQRQYTIIGDDGTRSQYELITVPGTSFYLGSSPSSSL